jgi:plastocyanin
MLSLGSLGTAVASSQKAARPKVHRVTIVDAMHYEPATLKIRPGDSVIWTNKDMVSHTVTSKDGGFDSKAIAPGKTWKLASAKKGLFAYACSFHPMMKGRLEVN